MIKNLDFSVTFPNGRTLSGRHAFTTGLTLVSGPNGAGKSTRLEMLRFALFGSAMLRGSTSDYAKIDAKLTFSVLDRELTVERSLKTATIKEAGAAIATGHKAVTAKVVEILGYGPAVFDIANCAKQKEIAALSALPPAERRRMVDQVIGLDVVEALAKWAGQEARAADKAADMAEAALPVVPAEPTRPEGYRPRADIETERDSLRAAARRKQQLELFLAHPPLVPIAPAKPMTQLWLSTLENHERQRLDAIRQLASVRAQLDRIPLRTMTAEEIEQARAYDTAVAFFRRPIERPTHTVEELDDMRRQWTVVDSYEEWAGLRKQGFNCCPSCNHTFPIQQEAMAALGDFEGKPPPAHPVLTRLEIQRAHLTIERYTATAAERAMHDAVLAAGRPEGDVGHAEAALRLAPERDRLVAEAVRLEPLAAAEDLSIELRDAQALTADWAAYGRAAEARRLWDVKAEIARSELAPLGEPETALEALEALRDAVVAYDAAHASWSRLHDARRQAEADITERRAEAARWRAARDALETIRTRTKGHLLPSLGAVAGTLLSRITGGAFSRVVVDDDFEVRVEGQPLATLSGSESTATNLALRIALGQILTNRVFGVFLGDEVDADMDETRAAATAASLRTLVASGAVSQMVVVSHKRIEADHYLDL